MEALVVFILTMCLWPGLWFIIGYALGRYRIRIRIERLE
jgi:hypothetical protein